MDFTALPLHLHNICAVFVKMAQILEIIFYARGKPMKKILIFTIFTFCFMFLTACSDNKESGDNNENNGEEITDMKQIDFNPTSEIIEIASFDGYTFKGRLTLPGEKNIDKLVIFVNSSGPHTYDTRRNFGAGIINYNDLYAKRFQEQGIAFFAYNTRGVDIGDTPPMYYTLNEEQYNKYLPSIQVDDIYYMIKAVKASDTRLANSKVLLLGASEGAVIAPLVAEKYPYMVDALFLTGVPVDNMRDVLTWQNSGGASMVWYRNNFDKDGDGKISKEEYEADPNEVIKSILQNTAFDLIDVNKDGYIDEQDFYIIMKDSREAIFRAIENKDNLWLRNNYGGGLIPLNSEWFLEHFELKSNMELLPELDLPIFIFHGTLDQNCDVNKVYELKDKVMELKKTNIIINIFDGHNHDLNFPDYVTKAVMPEGMQSVFDSVYNFKIN